MKRSEAEELFIEELENIIENNLIDLYGVKRLGQDLLKLAEEEIGMIPPYPKGPYNPEELINDWEPEDED